MPAFTIYDSFDKNHPGWLHYRVGREQEIYRGDVERIIEANPGCERKDPLVRDLQVRARAGQLERPRGRP